MEDSIKLSEVDKILRKNAFSYMCEYYDDEEYNLIIENTFLKKEDLQILLELGFELVDNKFENRYKEVKNGRN